MPKRRASKSKESNPIRSERIRTFKSNIKVVPKTEGQRDYVEMIEDNDITICNGRAGTGKTLLAVGMALRLLKEYPNRYKKVIMVRPAVTVKGEDLGHLPGNLDEKMLPFMLPMLDSLQFYLQNSEYLAMIERRVLEISPISHMRGRTFNNCIIIFDEAQNSTESQMKMVITRIGFSTKLIIEGDVTQSDLHGEDSEWNGLRDAMERFDGIEGVGVCNLKSKDVLRSPILKRLLKSYE